MNGSLLGSIGLSCVLGVALVAGRAQEAAKPGDQPTKMRAATIGSGNLWGVKSGQVWVPYRFDTDISDKAAAIWTLNMNRWQKLTRGRVNFVPVTTIPAGNWVQLRSNHAKIGSCGLGPGSPTGCQIRDSSILGIGLMRPIGATATIHADLALHFGSRDDLQGVDFENYVTVDPPNQPGTSSPLQIASIEYQSDGKIITWYEPGSINPNSGYKLWRSKGTFTDLDAEGAPAAASLPAGVDAVFSATHQGSTMRGAAVLGNTVYSYWNVGSALKVARGSSTNLDSVEALQTVTLPNGKSLDDLIDVAFDEDNVLNSWFVDGYDDYGPGIKVPNSYRRYVGTYRDLDGAANDAGVAGDTLKRSNYGAALHELGHALGFVHEHQRPDRDKYVWVDPEANEKDPKDYGKKAGAVVHSSFDFASIMHYKNSKTGRLDAKHTSLPGNNSLTWRDVTGLVDAYGVAPYTIADAWAASAAADIPLAFSPLSGMVDSDIIGGDFTKGGAFFAWYVFNGHLERSWGHEWDPAATGNGFFNYPLQIDGAFAGPIGIAIQHDDDGHVYTWFARSTSSACPSGLYRSTGSSEDLDKFSPPLCVKVFNAAHGADHIIDFAIDNYAGSDRVYTLYDDGTISVGSSTNLSSIKAPANYTLPDGIAAKNVYSFGLVNGVAVFHSKGYRVTRDQSFKNKF